MQSCAGEEPEERMSNATYRKREEGGATVFKVTPGKAPKFWWFIIIGALLVVGGIADHND